jgi:cholesterol oxidase
VKRVCQETDAREVQVIVHCIGSMSFLMAALSGELQNRIRSAICSQVGLHPVGNFVNELKAGAYFGTLLWWLGVKSLPITVDAGSARPYRFVDTLLRLYPTDDPCDSPFCRRERLVFGESYLHRRLNQATHDALVEMFADPSRPVPARVNLRTLRHLARILRRGYVVDEWGEDVYRPQARRLNFPILFLAGSENRIFPPKGTRQTRAWLQEVNSARKDLYEWELIPGWAHMDFFVGREASETIFPRVFEYLQKH